MAPASSATDERPPSAASNPRQGLPLAPGTAGLPNPVQWSEGMLLSPQHFQQNDLFWHEQLRYRLAQCMPHGWGIGALELDGVKLKAGLVALRKLECIMPDGTPIVFPGSYEQALEIDANAALAQEPAGVRISLVLPVRSAAATRHDGAFKRYDAVPGHMAIDENTGVGMEAVDRLRPRIQLWVGQAIPAQYVACPLLELTRRSDSRVIELRPYHPPLLRWEAADFLAGTSLRKRLHLVNTALWARLRELADNRDGDGPDDDPALAAAGQALDGARRLAAVLPQFGLLVNRAEAKPLELYDSLALVVGAMAGFGLNPIPPVLDAYQHDNCEPQFRRALDYVVGKLSYVATGHKFFEFDKVGEHRFVRELPPQTGHELIVELRLGEGRSAGHSDRLALEQWLKDACIASEELLDQALRARVSARPRLLGSSEITKRGFRSSGVLFAIDNESIDGDGLRPQPLLQAGKRLAIDGYAGGSGLQPASILLYQARPGGARLSA